MSVLFISAGHSGVNVLLLCLRCLMISLYDITVLILVRTLLLENFSHLAYTDFSDCLAKAAAFFAFFVVHFCHLNSYILNWNFLRSYWKARSRNNRLYWGEFFLTSVWVLKLSTTQHTAQHTIIQVWHLFSPLFCHSFILHRRVSGIQQLNEWTDILTHELRSSSLSDKNSFESKSHKKEIVKTNSNMAKVYEMYAVEFC